MKKNISIGLIIAAILITLFSISAQDPNKMTVTLTVDQWNGTLQVIEQSQAAHVQVSAVQALIIPQLQEQSKAMQEKAAADAKAKADSLKTKKP
jgi:hypothetical protein